MLEKFFDRAMRKIPLTIFPAFDLKKKKNIANEVSFTIIAPTEKTLDIVLKTPMV